MKNFLGSAAALPLAVSGSNFALCRQPGSGQAERDRHLSTIAKLVERVEQIGCKGYRSPTVFTWLDQPVAHYIRWSRSA